MPGVLVNNASVKMAENCCPSKVTEQGPSTSQSGPYLKSDVEEFPSPPPPPQP